jgi:putative PIN family toxin of toxin-antitoxin system
MKVVLDTNIVLDLFVFRDARVAALHDDLASRKVQWLATSPMREELAAVLAYEQIDRQMSTAQESAPRVLAAFDAHAHLVAVPPACKFTCRDGDDQKFIDLAVAHGARLLSKDKQVLALKRKLALQGIEVSALP